MWNPYQTLSYCWLAYILSVFYFHYICSEGKEKLALANQVWELNKKAVLFSERKGCFTTVSHRINPDCQKECFSQPRSQKPCQSFAYISFNRFYPSPILEEAIWSLNLVRYSVRTKEFSQLSPEYTAFIDVTWRSQTNAKKIVCQTDQLYVRPLEYLFLLWVTAFLRFKTLLLYSGSLHLKAPQHLDFSLWVMSISMTELFSASFNRFFLN